jgi:hypothetical protein
MTVKRIIVACGQYGGLRRGYLVGTTPVPPFWIYAGGKVKRPFGLRAVVVVKESNYELVFEHVRLGHTLVLSSIGQRSDRGRAAVYSEAE